MLSRRRGYGSNKGCAWAVRCGGDRPAGRSTTSNQWMSILPPETTDGPTSNELIPDRGTTPVLRLQPEAAVDPADKPS